MTTRLTGAVVLDDRDIQERFVRGTGRGGQNLHKEATAVELRVDLAKASLPSAVRARLRVLGGRHVTKQGLLVVVSRAHRSQARNRESARARLTALVKRALNPVAPRRKTTRPADAREATLRSKHWKSALKQSRHVKDAE